jgi:hypothetical protein
MLQEQERWNDKIIYNPTRTPSAQTSEKCDTIGQIRNVHTTESYDECSVDALTVVKTLDYNEPGRVKVLLMQKVERTNRGSDRESNPGSEPPVWYAITRVWPQVFTLAEFEALDTSSHSQSSHVQPSMSSFH